MISWQDYLLTLVNTFRRYYDTLSDQEKSLVQLNLTFIEPCQIELFSFEKDGQMIFVTLDSSRSDEITIHERVKRPFSQDIRSKLLAYGISEDVISDIEGKKRIGWFWQELEPNSSVYFFPDLQKLHPNPKDYATTRFAEIKGSAQAILASRKRVSEYTTIEEQVKRIKTDIEKIKDESLRLRMLETTGEIGNSISAVKQLEHHEQRLSSIEQEIGGVRKMIGTTKEFQDFRVFTTDVEDLKKSHVHKEVFATEIRRLEERIDKGLQALNTRIEDLKAIKFWSKRTILEIALFIWGAIVTLYVAGIIKF